MLKPAFTNLNGIEKYFPSIYGEVNDCQLKRYERAFKEFKNYFGKASAYIASSSGRVEVCGNHTDHNGGKVLCCAISLDSLAMFLPTDNNIIHIKSEGYDDIIINIDDEPKEQKGTSGAIVRGVLKGFSEKGYNVGGFDAFVTSNVLGGAGISSSASFEILICEILDFLYNNSCVSAKDKAIISQFSENVYYGKPCGLLDQSAIAFGGLKMIDFCSKDDIIVSDIKNDLADYSLILINTGGSHANLSDEYASVPQEMFSVAKALNVTRLIESSYEDFLTKLPTLKNISDRAVLRAIHFYEENERVQSACDALNEKNYDKFLEQIRQSGLSSLYKLQNCYVSGSNEQPIPKALSITSPYLCGGANRVHGGGFAGCILNIVKNENVNQFVDVLSSYYGSENIIRLKVRSVGSLVL